MTDAIASDQTSLPGPEAADVRRILTYSSAKANRKILWLGLLLLGLGIFIAYTSTSFDLRDKIMLPLALVLGVGLTLYGVFKQKFPGKPALTLSPAGVGRHIEWVKDILIPWRAVKGVGTTDISGTVRGHSVTFRDVTVVLVSRAFYDRHIHVHSWVMRGPGWDFNFVPQGNIVQVALHHEMLSATADELRSAVEARWKVFGKQEMKSAD